MEVQSPDPKQATNQPKVQQSCSQTGILEQYKATATQDPTQQYSSSSLYPWPLIHMINIQVQ